MTRRQIIGTSLWTGTYAPVSPACSGTTHNGNGLITSPGQHQSPGGSFMLMVTVNSNDVVEFRIEERGTSKVLAEQKSGSTWQRWFFYWESDSRLWVQSSDIGLFAVWEKGADAPFSRHDIQKGDPLLTAIPSAVESYLPNTLRVRFELP